MAAAQRKLLEELMGSAAIGGVPDLSNFRDEKICKSFLCGLCPYEIFTNTKADLGPCHKVHVEKLKKDYEKDLEKGGKDFLREFLSDLRTFIGECDKKIRQNQSRLDKTPEDKRVGALVNEIADLANEINTINKIVESLGEEGKVMDALAALKKADELTVVRSSKEAELLNLTQGGNPQANKLRVCEICSSYLSIYDSDRRLADHFSGKMHLGFLLIRDKVKELEEKLASKDEESRSHRDEKRDSEPRKHDDRRDRDRDRERDRDRDRDRDRRRDDYRRDDYRRDDRRRSRSPYRRRR
ncbi:splicing factor [Clydaea vesicula]|uniref:Splicing factor n=1 Tax=Clydaea vesicula TaxID=447962 RepID=A0AAD5TWH8_9FUNG|nr:splicing factor [Clydaea vesicula]